MPRAHSYFSKRGTRSVSDEVAHYLARTVTAPPAFLLCTKGGTSPQGRSYAGLYPHETGGTAQAVKDGGLAAPLRGKGFRKPLCHSQARDISPERGDKILCHSQARDISPGRGDKILCHSQARDISPMRGDKILCHSQARDISPMRGAEATPTCRAENGAPPAPFKGGRFLPTPSPLLGRGHVRHRPRVILNECEESRGTKSATSAPPSRGYLIPSPAGRANPLVSTDARESIRSARLRLGMRAGGRRPPFPKNGKQKREANLSFLSCGYRYRSTRL